MLHGLSVKYRSIMKGSQDSNLQCIILFKDLHLKKCIIIRVRFLCSKNTENISQKFKMCICNEQDVVSLFHSFPFLLKNKSSELYCNAISKVFDRMLFMWQTS